MNPTGQRTNNPFRWLTLMAARGGLVLLSVCAVAGLAAGRAVASDTHAPLFALGEIPAEGPHGEPVASPGPLLKTESLTVDSGHVWVAEDTQNLGPSRVDEFDAATGAFIAQPIHLPAPPEGERRAPTGYGYGYGEGIAVGHPPGEEADVYVGGEAHGVSVVSIFNEAGVLGATWSGHATPRGSFGVTEELGDGRLAGAVQDVAVDNSSSPLDAGRGDVFVLSLVIALNSKTGREEPESTIDVFHPEKDGEERYVGEIAGVSPSEPFHFATRIAVNEVNGDLLVLDQNGTSAVNEFAPTGIGGYGFVRKLGGPPPSGSLGGVETLAVDGSNGEVYLTEKEGQRLDEFSAADAYLGHVEGVPSAFDIAVDPASHNVYVGPQAYGPDIVVPDVTTAPASDLKPGSVTLNGTVDPDGAGGATCEFEWGTTTAFGKVAPCSEEVPNGESSVAVHASLTGMERDQTYYYRLTATNANGSNPGEAWQDQQFFPPGAIVREEFALNVADTSVSLGAKIDPGGTPTSYYFQYGTGSEYGQELPVPPGEAIGAGKADVTVPSLLLQGLTPGTVYHYRAVAVNEIEPGVFETVNGADHTFTTQAAHGTSATADGRQWELVSPADKSGALIEGFGYGAGVMQASADGDAIVYRASSPTESEPHGGFAHVETVLSTRAGGGWSSQDISAPHARATHVTFTVGDEFQTFSEGTFRMAQCSPWTASSRCSPQKRANRRPICAPTI